ncbi:MAG: hypothetical protein AseanaTS_13940 [Candidatus Pelagadaptatus aseana]|uniref:hypothetical protein n=1 Tax=Candidatus Pelagadaptatus aseana TaxID=3120508 RepID=UPI0039B3362B
MLELRPSRIVVALYMLAWLMVWLGIVNSSLNRSSSLWVGGFATVLMLAGVIWHWLGHRGRLCWSADQPVWLTADGSAQAVSLNAATGWSDWILRIEILPSSAGRFSRYWRRRHIMLLADNADPESRRQLRVHMLSQ